MTDPVPPSNPPDPVPPANPPSTPETAIPTYLVQPPSNQSALGESDITLLAYAIRSKIESGDLSVVEALVDQRLKQVEHQQWVERETMRLQALELTNRQVIAERQENRKDRANIATKNNLRIIVAAFMATFISALGYGVIANKDTTPLANTIFAGAMGLLGGGGGAVILGRKSEGDRHEQPAVKNEP
ncbi:MAG: hypothetical protein NW224_14130 [Leptolyngbyaceae cyanobacterium bins.302]|nr:hypothetical protein [Leptolyngbyaceae cyanobacterium bins.302]